MPEIEETPSAHTNAFRGAPAEEAFVIPTPDKNILGGVFMQIAMESAEVQRVHGPNTNYDMTTEGVEIIQQSQLPQCYKINMCMLIEMVANISKLKEEYEHTDNKTEILKKIMLMSLDIAKEAINYMAPDIDEDTIYSLSYRVAHDPRVEATPRFEPSIHNIIWF